MPSTPPILPDDRHMTELVSNKLALLILDTLGLGVSACRFGLPRSEDFIVKRRTQLQALAVTLRCVTVSPGSEGEPVSAIHASSERLVSLLDELFQDFSALTDWEGQPASLVEKIISDFSHHTRLLLDGISDHLRLIGSSVAIDPELVARCEAVLHALPAEFGTTKVGAKKVAGMD